MDVAARVKNMLRDAVPDILNVWEHFFPKQFVVNIILPSTNSFLDDPLQYGEFI